MNSIDRDEENTRGANARLVNRPRCPKFRLHAGLICLLGLTICVSSTSAYGQLVYTPEHPEVEAMAKRALASLTNRNAGLDQRTLMALAVVETEKRYNQKIPRNHPLVKSALDGIIAGVPLQGAPSGILIHRETYFPCLALILLAETDAVKHKPQIKKLIEFLETRQLPNGAYTYLAKTDFADTSQTQFSALAMFVAKHHGFNLDVQMAKRTLQWTIGSQLPTGNWVYTYGISGAPNDFGQPNNVGSASLSMHAAGVGTAYLLSDVLQLHKRAKSMSQQLSGTDVGLPKTVSIYVKPIDGENKLLNKSGPLVQFDRARLANTTRGGNAWFENNFKVDPVDWTFYYLYALERYAYFREQAEGNVGDGKLKNWYDQCVEYLKTRQQPDGSFKGSTREAASVATAFGLLVLVRSSEVINMPTSLSELAGGEGFKQDAVLRQSNGQLRSIEAERDLSDLLSMMKEDASQEQLQDLADSLKKQILEFRQKDDKSRGEIKAFLQSMIAARNYYRRLIAVRFLAGEQDMNNVPALLYALGDPDLRICLEAHDGLRLISRKIDSMKLSPKTRTNAARNGVLTEEEDSRCRLEFDSMKKQWTDWFTKIRPGAELLD